MKRIKVLASLTNLTVGQIYKFMDMFMNLSNLKEYAIEEDSESNPGLEDFLVNQEQSFVNNQSQLNQIEAVKWDKISEEWERAGEPSFEKIRTDIFCESVLIYLYGRSFKFSTWETWEEALEEAKGGAGSGKWRLNNLKSIAMDIMWDNIEPSDDIEYLLNKSDWGIKEAEMAYLLGLNTEYVNTIERNYAWDFILLFQDCLAVVNGERNELGIFFKRIYNRNVNSQNIKSILSLALVRQLDLETK